MKRRALAAATLSVLVVAAAAVLRPSAGSDRTTDAPPSAPTTASPAPAERTLAEQDCLAALAAPEANSQLLAQERKRRVDNYLEGQGDELSQALAADLAGVGEQLPPVPGEPFVGDQIVRYGTPMEVGRRLSREERRQLADLLATEGVAGLLALDDDSLLAAMWEDTTTTGHLIREHAAGRLAGLLDVASSLAISRHELATAMDAGLSPRDFAVLLDAADVDPAGTWFMDANLAKVAAFRNRPDILRLLRARGVDPAAAHRRGHPSVLDDLAAKGKPADADGIRALADVVRQLAAAGDRPYLPSTLATLGHWLPGVALPALHPDSVTRLSALADADGLAELETEWDQKIAAAKRLEDACKSLIAADPERALRAFEGTGLASKLRYQEVLVVRRDQVAEALRLAAETRGGDAPNDITLNRRELEAMTAARKDGRWRAMLALADRGGGRAHKMLLPLVLRTDAPLEVLLVLARRAARWPRPPNVPDWYLDHRLQDGVLQLAMFPRDDIVAVVAALEPLGLDLHYVDAQGRNAFTILAMFIQSHNNEARLQFAELLASRSVAVKPRAFGLDPLDTVLMRLVEFPQSMGSPAIPFVRFLIDHGAPIEASHLELARQLAAADAAVYRRLVRTVPALAS